MTDDDDWAPLTMAQQLGHPGECAAPLAARPLPDAAPATPSVSPAEIGSPVGEPDPAAELALLRLKQRLLQAPTPDSFVAAVHHREHKAERKRRAASITLPELPPPPTQAAPTAVVAITTPAGDDDHDPREQEPWFRALPGREQERLRAHWYLERHRRDDDGFLRQQRLRRAILYGTVLFFVVGLAQAIVAGGLPTLVAMTVGGAVAAGTADLCGGGRFTYAGFGAIVCLLVMGPSAIVGGFTGTAIVSLACYGMAMIGMDGEMRQRGGFRDA